MASPLGAFLAVVLMGVALALDFALWCLYMLLWLIVCIGLPAYGLFWITQNGG